MSGHAAFRQIVWTALVASVVTGIAITLVQLFTTVPLIARAEVYEQTGSGAAQTAADGHEHAAHGHISHDHGGGWAPQDGFERTFYTGLTTFLTAFGYALLLGACLSQLRQLRQLRQPRSAGWRTGLALGAAGFVVFQLAPALGLPPKPPGVPLAEILPRQLWWLGTVIATALALACWYHARKHAKRFWVPMGAVLMLLPHLIGAPQAPAEASAVPRELLTSFTIAALVTAALFWLILGTLQGYLFGRSSARHERLALTPP